MVAQRARQCDEAGHTGNAQEADSVVSIAYQAACGRSPPGSGAGRGYSFSARMSAAAPTSAAEITRNPPLKLPVLVAIEPMADRPK
jgi:hypothetical protein